MVVLYAGVFQSSSARPATVAIPGLGYAHRGGGGGGGGGGDGKGDSRVMLIAHTPGYSLPLVEDFDDWFV